MTYYRVYVFNGTEEVAVLKPFKSREKAIAQAEKHVNQPYKIKPIN